MIKLGWRAYRLSRFLAPMNSRDQHERTRSGGLRDVPETAEYLNISERHLREMLRRGEISSVRFGHRVLFAQADLDAAIDRARVTA